MRPQFTKLGLGLFPGRRLMSQSGIGAHPPPTPHSSLRISRGACERCVDAHVLAYRPPNEREGVEKGRFSEPSIGNANKEMKTHFCPAVPAQRWSCHRTTTSRIIQSFARPGWKSHAARGASHRYPMENVETVERFLKAKKEVQR